MELTKERKHQLSDFCNRVGIKFKKIELLDQAFHHRSLTNEAHGVKNNERLEFLGDSVLGMVTAAYLYTNLDNPEGDLAKIKSAVVSEKALAPVALRFGIDKLLLLGHGEELTGGRTKPAILADCMEAIIGAYYLDSGYKAAEKYVLSFIALIDIFSSLIYVASFCVPFIVTFIVNVISPVSAFSVTANVQEFTLSHNFFS